MGFNVYGPWQEWSQQQTLHVAAAYSNPLRWQTRRQLLHDFRRHMAASPNVQLYVGEVAFGDRPYEVTGLGHPHDLQLRTQHELWLKENLLNLIVQRFPPDWKYGAIVDGDLFFTRPDWALEAVHQLQHYAFVQLFSSYSDLSSQHRPFRTMSSFGYNYVNRREAIQTWRSAPLAAWTKASDTSGTAKEKLWPAEPGATGGAWAFTRSAFDAVGGLLETCILGSGDWHMAFSLAGLSNRAIESKRCTEPYVESLLRWHERAQALKQNIGYLDCHAIHHFHGSMTRRSYSTRWQILLEEKFDPSTDLSRDWQGLLQLNGNKPLLRDKIRAYFRSRWEDDPSLYPPEKHLV